MRHVIGYRDWPSSWRRGVLRRELGLPAAAADRRRQRRASRPCPRPGANLLHDTTVLYGVAAWPAPRCWPGSSSRCRGSHRWPPGCPGWRCRVDGLVRAAACAWRCTTYRCAADTYGARLRGDARERGARRGRPGARRAAVHPVPVAGQAAPVRVLGRVPHAGARAASQDQEPTATISLLSDWSNTTPFPTVEKPYGATENPFA